MEDFRRRAICQGLIPGGRCWSTGKYYGVSIGSAILQSQKRALAPRMVLNTNLKMSKHIAMSRFSKTQPESHVISAIAIWHILNLCTALALSARPEPPSADPRAQPPPNATLGTSPTSRRAPLWPATSGLCVAQESISWPFLCYSQVASRAPIRCVSPTKEDLPYF